MLLHRVLIKAESIRQKAEEATHCREAFRKRSKVGTTIKREIKQRF